jgi:hypothetical protein
MQSEKESLYSRKLPLISKYTKRDILKIHISETPKRILIKKKFAGSVRQKEKRDIFC